MKYNTIAELSLCFLILPHGNADPERGFSLNKNVLAVHGFSIKEEKLEAFRMVKDFIIKNNGVMNIEISKDLIKHCKVSHTRYQCYQNEQRKFHEEEKSRKKLLKKEESKNELIREKAVLIKSIKVTENCVDEANTELENLTKSKILSRDKLIASQTKISMGLKRKAELSAEIETIDKKIKEMRVRHQVLFTRKILKQNSEAAAQRCS